MLAFLPCALPYSVTQIRKAENHLAFACYYLSYVVAKKNYLQGKKYQKFLGSLAVFCACWLFSLIFI